MEDLFSSCETSEQKLKVGLEAMRAAISQEGSPRLKDFWEVRKTCIPLFKEGIHPAVRSQFWDEFSELSKEARALKNMFNKESAFATEQIALAISALEKRLQHIDEEVETMTLPSTPFKELEVLQKRLNVLSDCASTINALRKELIGTKARLSSKNSLFTRLSAVGDQVFPKRRECLSQINDRFSREVDLFTQKHFSTPHPKGSLHKLREEIKAFQQSAKIFTLNAESFSHARMLLSECWGRLRNKSMQSRDSLRVFGEKIEEALKGGVDEASEKLSALYLEMKQAGLHGLDERFSKARQELFLRMKKRQLKEEEEWLANTTELAPLVEKRNEVRENLEEYGKARASSGHDFRKAMEYDVFFNEEKERLAKIETAITHAHRVAGRNV